MKNLNPKTIISSLILAIGVLFVTTPIFAQSNSMTVEIPFNFHVGNEKYVAGNYEIKRIKDNIYLLKNATGSVKAMAQTPLTIDESRSISEARITFNRYGNKYFLRQIFNIESAVGRALYESKTERNARKGIEAELEAGVKKSQPAKVEIAVKIK